MKLKNTITLMAILSFSFLLNAMEAPKQNPNNQDFKMPVSLIQDSEGNTWAIPTPMSEVEHNDSLIDQMLLKAAEDGEIEFVNKLVELEANLEIKNDKGRTPLMLAAINKHLEIVKLLLEKGADVNAQDCQDRTVIMLALIVDRPDIAAVCITPSANLLDLKDQCNFSGSAYIQAYVLKKKLTNI